MTTRQFDNFITGTIRGAVTDEISKATQVAMEEFRKLQTQYVPLSSYPAVSSPDKRFNQDVNQAIRSSGHYTFYGLTARYAIARLASLPAQVPAELKFVIADPTQDGVVTIAPAGKRSSETTPLSRGRRKSFSEGFMSPSPGCT